MQTSVNFREFRRSDAAFLENIIRKTWNYDKFCTPKVAKQMARVFLASCLTEQTFTKVALIGEKPVGIIMAKNIVLHKKSLPSLFNLAKAILPLTLSKDGRQTTNFFKQINFIDNELLSSSGKKFDGEITFFAIGKECQGLGIGKNLFDFAREYLSNSGAKNFFLYTDSSCNFGFYEHQGMARLCEISPNLSLDIWKNTHFFLYEGNL
ncbi:MAG: GNAT family N-acetyltransferase [Oscillospiraceae bacterium]